MSDAINRRAFLGHMARTAAAGAMAGNLVAMGAEKAASQPAVEWRNKQATMGYAKLGRTNFMSSRCVFGAGSLKGQDDLPLLEMAVERGLNYIDTGRAYKKSESVLAGFLKKHRDKCWIVSKAGHIGWPDMTIAEGEDEKAGKLYTEQLEESLKQLDVETIDCYMVQGVGKEWVVKMDGLYNAFEKAKKAGKVRYFGLSTHTEVGKICDAAAQSGRYDVIMLSVNPKNLKELTPSIKKMREAGIGIVSMKVSGRIGKDSKAYDAEVGDLFAGQKLSPYQMAYAYMLARGGVDAFISHTPNRTILDENLAAAALKLPEAALDVIEAHAVAFAEGACHHCGACTRACPEHVNAADMLRYHAYIHNYGEREMARELYDALGRENAERCTGCGSCKAVCPESIDMAAVIAGLRADLA